LTAERVLPRASDLFFPEGIAFEVGALRTTCERQPAVQ
jgi:hypothetical protein